MWRANSLENTLMLGKIAGMRRRGWQRMRWLDDITDPVDLGLRKLWETVEDEEAQRAAVHGVVKSQTQLRDWTTRIPALDLSCLSLYPTMSLPAFLTQLFPSHFNFLPPLSHLHIWGFTGGSDGQKKKKKSTCNAGNPGEIPGLGRSLGGGHATHSQYSCLENPHGQRSLGGYSPWGRKDLGMTEWLSTAQHCSTASQFF